MATFSVCGLGRVFSSVVDVAGFDGLECDFSSSCSCCVKRRLNSATFGFSLLAGVPVRARDLAWSYRAFLRLPNGPDSSGGRRGLRDSLFESMLVCLICLPGECCIALNHVSYLHDAKQDETSLRHTLYRRSPREGDSPSRLLRAPLRERSDIPWQPPVFEFLVGETVQSSSSNKVVVWISSNRKAWCRYYSRSRNLTLGMGEVNGKIRAIWENKMRR